MILIHQRLSLKPFLAEKGAFRKNRMEIKFMMFPQKITLQEGLNSSEKLLLNVIHRELTIILILKKVSPFPLKKSGFGFFMFYINIVVQVISNQNDPVLVKKTVIE